MKSGGGVLIVATLQLLIGVSLLGTYEGYKKYYFNNFLGEEEEQDAGSQSIGMRVSGYESPLDFRSPMWQRIPNLLMPFLHGTQGFTFYLSILSEGRRELNPSPVLFADNIFAVCGLFGVVNARRELIITFFVYNAAQMVLAFRKCPLRCASGIRSLYYFVDLCTDAGVRYKGEPLKLTSYEQAAMLCAVRAVDEIKAKQRDEYNRITVLGDTLQFEADAA
ncbi:hypothetical protein QJQ45_014251 [Haematococcus lacustris]|nr:hypothetical protein QJQ45_014251 [Haematococcus lacustris]